MILLFWMLAWASASPLSDGVAAFEAGQLDEAIALWEEADSDGRASGIVHYNLGNAHYRRGDFAVAVAHWREARLMRPRDGRVVHNLALARSKLVGTPPPVGAPFLGTEVVTPGELGFLAVSCLLIAAMLGWWRRRQSRVPVGAAIALALVGLVLGAASLTSAHAVKHRPTAVVLDAGAVVRDAADPAEPASWNLSKGSEVQVVRRLRGFLLISTSEDRFGWIPEAAVWVVGPSRVKEAQAVGSEAS